MPTANYTQDTRICKHCDAKIIPYGKAWITAGATTESTIYCPEIGELHEPQNEDFHQIGCICADCSGAELTSDND